MADIRINALATTATTPASDDFLALDGTAQGTRKILATNIANNVTDVILGASGPSVKSTLSARAPRQGLVFNGTSAPTVTVPAVGTADFSIGFWVTPNTSVAYGGILSSVNGGVYLISLTPKILNESSAVVVAANAALTLSKNSNVVYTRSGTTGTWYINGVAAGSGTDSTNYSVAWSYIGSTVVGILGGLNLYNRALSASEVVALYEAGAPAGADYNNASNTAINTNTAVDGVAGNNTFAATAGGSFTGASATGFTAVSGGGAYAAASFQPNFTVQPGQIIRVTYTATVNSGTVLASLMNSSVSSISSTHTVTTGTRTVEFVATAASTSARVIFGSSGGSACNFSVSSVSVVRSGLLLAPDAAQAGGGLVWYDTSGNAANITLPASGVSWNVPTSGYVTSGSSLNLSAGGTNQNITLTPSGTGGTVIQSNANNGDVLLKLRATGASPNGAIRWTTNTDTYTVGIGSRFNIADNGLEFLIGSTTTGAALRSNGNFLIGGTIDSSNGNLQLKDTSGSSTKGIGFGTDVSLYRSGTSSLSVACNGTFVFAATDNGAADPQIQAAGGKGTRPGYSFTGDNNTGLFSTLADTLYFSTGGTTALTLDSSQRCILAGALRLNNAYTAGAPTATGYVTLQDSAGNTYKVLVGT